MNKEIYAKRDKEHLESLAKLLQGNDFGSVIRNWPAYVLRRDLPRFLAHYELFKQVIDLPGHIIELGVYKGAGLFTWNNLLETFNTNDRTKKAFGFDHFEGLLPKDFSDADGALCDESGKVHYAYKTLAEDLRTLVKLHNNDNLLAGVERCSLIEGDVFETIPKFIKDNPGIRISLCYFDLDLYESTKFCLELLYPLVVKGGIIAFDEYGLVPWEGESRAVDEYFEAQNLYPIIKRFPFSPAPGGYIIK